MGMLHKAGCACCRATGGGMTRRGLLGTALAAGAIAGAPAVLRAAAYGSVEACLVNCMDPRITEDNHRYMAGRGWREGDYSHIVLAGGPIAAVAPAFADWRKAFWDNLAATVQLHAIRRLVAFSHRDCGAVGIAYGKAAAATPEVETATHTGLLAEFRRQALSRHPALIVETGIMTLDGEVLMAG
jgi:hypothetical protein